MRILLINQYYHPDIAATAQLCADLAEDLVQLGHEVTVIAGTAAYRTPHEGPRPLRQAPLPLYAQHRGVRILRVPVLSLPVVSHEVLQKGLGYASFLAGALVRTITAERPDVVLALSTPPLVAALGLLCRSLRSCRFVYWVQDVYPDLAIALGVMQQGGLAARWLQSLSCLLYRRADAIIALDDAMAARLTRAGAPAARIRIIDNWCDGVEVTPQAPERNLLRQQALQDREMIVGYAGNLGRGHDFTTVARALPLLRSDPVSFVFIGGGPQRERLAELARTERLDRVHFLPPQARSRIRDALTLGDVGLVTLDEGLAGMLVPSKIYGMLAAGRPILYVGPPTGRIAELLSTHEIGESVRNHDVAGLIAAVRRLSGDADRRRRMGMLARKLFEQIYTRSLATARHEAVLREVLGASVQVPRPDRAAREQGGRHRS